jgi:alpha-beta hydrolase superfamily lysophospholipase
MFGQWLDGERFAAVMKWLEACDQATVAKAMGEVFAADLRPGLAKATAPVLLLAAYNKGYEGFGLSAAAFEKPIREQLIAPKAKLVVHPNCKHFIMYDEPAWMFKEMGAFLGRK